MNTLKQSLARLGIHTPFAVPSGFQTCPTSLMEIIRILNLPEPNFAGLKNRFVYSFSENKAQGLVFAHDDVWFLSSKDTVFRCSVQGPDLYQPTGVHRLAARLRNHLVEDAGLDGDDYVHIGSLGYLDGLVFVPIENKNDSLPWLLLGINEELRLVGYSFLPHEMLDAFVAISPWNKLLYVCSRSETNHLYAYDISGFFQVLPDPERHGSLVDTYPPEDEVSISFFKEDGSPDHIHGVQGVSFSQDGSIFLAWYTQESGTEWTNHLRVYSALTGMFLYDKEYDFDGWMDEIEGLSIHPSGVLYVAVCDHDWPSTDEFEIHAFQ